jgi:hypothetical protein
MTEMVQEMFGNMFHDPTAKKHLRSDYVGLIGFDEG